MKVKYEIQAKARRIQSSIKRAKEKKRRRNMSKEDLIAIELERREKEIKKSFIKK